MGNQGHTLLVVATILSPSERGASVVKFYCPFVRHDFIRLKYKIK